MWLLYEEYVIENYRLIWSITISLLLGGCSYVIDVMRAINSSEMAAYLRESAHLLDGVQWISRIQTSSILFENKFFRI